jgi:hypothetical protein
MLIKMLIGLELWIGALFLCFFVARGAARCGARRGGLALFQVEGCVHGDGPGQCKFLAGYGSTST